MESCPAPFHADAARHAPKPDVDVESSSDDYARRFSGPVGRWFLETQARITHELLIHLRPPCRILDVGGGHAQLTPSLVDAGYEVTVLGSSQSCEQRLRRWTHSGRCRFEVGRLSDLPFADRSFDVAIAFRLLSHVASPVTLISELCRVSRHSVIVDYTSSRSLNCFASPFYPIKRRIEGNTRTFSVVAPRFVEEAFQRQLFRVTVSRPQYLFPMALHRLAGSAWLARAAEATGASIGLTRVFGSPVIVRADRQPMRGAQPDGPDAPFHCR